LARISAAAGQLPASKLYPTKQRPEQKIDAAVALMMAVGRAMAADDGQADILEFLRNPIF
jgi:phage terminase large subunit-like protein